MKGGMSSSRCLCCDRWCMRLWVKLGNKNGISVFITMDRLWNSWKTHCRHRQVGWALRSLCAGRRIRQLLSKGRRNATVVRVTTFRRCHISPYEFKVRKKLGIYRIIFHLLPIHGTLFIFYSRHQNAFIQVLITASELACARSTAVVVGGCCSKRRAWS